MPVEVGDTILLGGTISLQVAAIGTVSTVDPFAWNPASVMIDDGDGVGGATSEDQQGESAVILQNDGNFVIRSDSNGDGTPDTVVAVFGVNHFNIETVQWQPNGDLVAYDINGNVVDSSGTAGTGDRLAMLEDGNLVIFDDQDNIIWQTGTAGNASTANSASMFVCFAKGTRIRIPGGEALIEDLKVGDLVETMDSGHQPLRWIGSQKHDQACLDKWPKLRPIRFAKGSIGESVPNADLFVSRQHRMLVRSQIVEHIFEVSKVLVPAVKLTNGNDISIATGLTSVEYFHLLFDKHQIIFANNAPTESLFTGPEALKALSKSALDEITCIQPNVLDPAHDPLPACQIVRDGKSIEALKSISNDRKMPLITSI